MRQIISTILRFAAPSLPVAALLTGAPAASALPQLELLTPAAEPTLGADATFLVASDNGRFVVFSSRNVNVLPGQVDQEPGSDDLFLYDRALSEAEVQTLYNDGYGLSCNHLD